MKIFLPVKKDEKWGINGFVGKIVKAGKKKPLVLGS